MPSTEETNPINPNPASSAAQGTSRIRPDGLPRSDKNFKKMIKDRFSKEEEEEDVAALEEDSDAPSPPSLFDLSAKSKVKPKLPNSSLNQRPFFADAEKAPVEESFLKQPPPLIMHDDDETGMAANGKLTPKKEGGLVKNERSMLSNEKELALADKTLADETLANKALADKPVDPKDLRTAKGLEEEPLKSARMIKEAPEKPVSDNFLHGEIVRDEVIKGKKGRPDVLSLDTDATVLTSKKEKSKLNTKGSLFAQENGDLSTVNPHLQHQSPIAFLADKAENMNEQHLTRSTVKDIVEQIVANMQTVQTEGKTDTIVTLRYPPILEGATVTLTAFEGTKREFNLSFANLTDDAKRFLDRKIAEDSLVESLARQDIIINTLTTTTMQETHTDPESYKYFAREEREQQRGRQSQQEADDEQA